MKPNARINLILLAGLAALLAACQFNSTPAHAPTHFEQNSPPVSQVESPLLPVVARLDATSAYHITFRSEERRTQPDGSTVPGISEYNYFWMHSEGQYGHNEHSVTTLVDPQSGTPGVMDESYMVDDLAFTYYPTCPPSAGQTCWSVYKRSGGNIPDAASDSQAVPDDRLSIDGVSRYAGFPLAGLVAQSVVIGDESIRGITATHYRLTDSQALSDKVRMQTGGAPNTPLEVSMAQMDIWLTVADRQPIQYIFQAEGKTESIAGSQVLQPFTIQEHYSVTEINSPMTITVPTEVLTAVATQLKALEIK